MPTWIKDATTHRFRLPQEQAFALVHVAGVMDATGELPPKLIIENHPDNRGASVLESLGRDCCIQTLSDEIGVKPHTIDWFVRGRDGILQRVSFHDKGVPSNNAPFPAAYGFSSVYPLTPKQHQELDETFRHAKQNRATPSSAAEQPPASSELQKIAR